MSHPPSSPLIYSGSRQGAKPYQEDSCLYWLSPSRRVIVAGVFDGHGGHNGLVASNTAKEQTKKFMEEKAHELESWSTATWSSCLTSLFAHLHGAIRSSFLSGEDRRLVDERGIVRAPSGDPVHGGTTATITVMKYDDDGGATVITANVGDSTAFLCPAPPASWDFLSVDHGPENQNEWNRIYHTPPSTYPTKLLFVYDKTTIMRKYECPLVFKGDGTKDQTFVANPWGYGLHPTNVRYEPAVYAVTPRSISKDSTCIAMTRALGDFYAHQFGLTHEPSITVRRISEPTTIILASDGVWDCWKYDDLHLFVNDSLKRGNVMQVGEAILEESIARAISNFGAKHFDDACLVTWQFVPTSPLPASSPLSPSSQPALTVHHDDEDDDDDDSLKAPIPRTATLMSLSAADEQQNNKQQNGMTD